VSEPLLIHPEDEDDVEPVSSTNETRSEEEEAADGAFDDESVPDSELDWRRAAESLRAIPRTAEVRPEEEEVEAEIAEAGRCGSLTLSVEGGTKREPV
jgi:hypothetical protein